MLRAANSIDARPDFRRPAASEMRGANQSGNHAHEALVQFPLIVENCLTDLIDRPHGFRVIRVIDEPAREHLIAVPRRIKEIDGLASRNAMSSRPDVERNVIPRDDIRCLADLVPRV
jgi:hypothetical protein